MYQLQFVDKGNLDVKGMDKVQGTVRTTTRYGVFPDVGFKQAITERQFNIKACHRRSAPINGIMLGSTQTHAISIAKGRFIIAS